MQYCRCMLRARIATLSLPDSVMPDPRNQIIILPSGNLLPSRLDRMTFEGDSVRIMRLHHIDLEAGLPKTCHRICEHYLQIGLVLS